MTFDYNTIKQCTEPPYGRSSKNEPAYLAHLHGLGLQNLPSTTGINLAAWFVLLGAGLTAENGRMAYVLPSAVLQNENLSSWRAWMRRTYDLVIWHTEADVWFSDARVAACVILMTPRPSSGRTVTFVNALEPVDGKLHDIDGIPAPAAGADVRDLSQVPAGDDLLIPGTTPAVLSQFAALPKTTHVEDLAGAKVCAGQKLRHKIFLLTDRDPSNGGVMRTVEGLSTTFRVNRNILCLCCRAPKP